MSDANTVIDLLKIGKDEAVAITGPGRKPLTYSGLRRQVTNTVSSLNELGVGRNDTVAIVLPNGPEMAVAFTAIATGATTAPLNPAYREKELQFYMSDLQVRLLVVEEGSDTPARSVAEQLEIPVAQLRRSPDSASIHFELVGDPVREGPRLGGFAQADDIALVLHTSGTTARPRWFR